ncbi:outer membrane protein OmpA-like peptidoglycan-associated protein [Saonia flava]|uniref:Outer membrane protein OmpA-like peptidoglycan-associated protein n=1 Tax=Saonia flava TaxID=523696 RepID=A0A846QUM6_9FLAO|nr:OmpA family protein [Saonia flava]NJB70917.1 outer membrane protein OmpA-like peptidoglycan-associated protein [Saonia flava]
MKFKASIVFFLVIVSLSFGQDKMSKADALFFGYDYKDAIVAYQKELREKPLTNQQYLNLADSYLKTGSYENASKTYLEVFKRDSTMSNHYFNKMLQSFYKTSGQDRIKAFLSTKGSGLSNELLENSDFNFELLKSNLGSELNYEIFNISANSPQADFSPTFYDDKLLFSSGRGHGNGKELYKPSGESYLDIFVSRIEQNGNANSATPFTLIPSSSFHKATPYYSNAQEIIFYVLSNADENGLLYSEEGKNTLAIGKNEIDGEFEYLLRDLNTSFYYPFYQESTGKLFFAANFEDGYGGTDLYYVYTNGGQIMSAPVNLGPRINSPGNEISPFIFENSLYFASDIFYGLGGMDIYKSNFQPNETFSIPINLGIGINSEDDDFGFVIRNNDTNGLLGYFSSNRKGGKGNDDIYGFNVAEKPGLKTIAVQGKVVKPASTTGVAKAYIRVFSSDNELLKEVYSDGEGQYQFEIPWRDFIKIEAGKERYSIYKKDLDESALNDIQKMDFHIDLALMDDLIEEKEGQEVIKLNKFFFDKGKSQITAEIAEELDKVVEAVHRFPEFQLRIESHTDSRGGSSTNFRLSQSRSDAIKKYLREKGVPESNLLYSVGYGEDKITNNCTNGVYCLDMLHRQNERSLIVVLNYNLLN